MEPMTSKQFLRKVQGKISPELFLNDNELYIRQRYPEANALMDEYTQRKILPTPALNHLKEIVWHNIHQELEQKLTAQRSKRTTKRSGICGKGNYSVQFFIQQTDERTQQSQVVLYTDDNGKHTFMYHRYHEAEKAADRFQANSSHAVYAEIKNVNGKEITTKIARLDSVARMMRNRPGPIMKTMRKGNSNSLKSYMSVRNDTCSFSRG